MSLRDLKFITKQIVKNYKRFIKNKLGKIDVSNGSTHIDKSIKDSIHYIFEVYQDYLRYGDLRPSDIESKRVLELGPGDNMGIALLFIADGASQVYLVDKYFSIRDKKNEIKIYKSLRSFLNENQKENFDLAIKLTDDDFQILDDKIITKYGKSIEEIKDTSLYSSFDFIVSRAVLQVVNKLRATFKQMHQFLKEEGIILHKVDLRDYGTFRRHKKHELGMLMFSNFVYRLMTNHSSLPNRKRINFYKKLLEKNNFISTVFISHIFGEEEIKFTPHKPNLIKDEDYTSEHENYINSIRNSLSKEFKSLSTEDLLVSGVFIKGTKK